MTQSQEELEAGRRHMAERRYPEALQRFEEAQRMLRLLLRDDPLRAAAYDEKLTEIGLDKINCSRRMPVGGGR